MVLADMSRIITKLTNGSKSYEIVTSFINSTYTISLFCVNKGHISANPDKVETGHAASFNEVNQKHDTFIHGLVNK